MSEDMWGQGMTNPIVRPRRGELTADTRQMIDEPVLDYTAGRATGSCEIRRSHVEAEAVSSLMD